jgi:hypothetical protein
MMNGFGYSGAMFRRLCLFLLILCLALPAAAAPLHCAPVTVHAAGHSEHHGKREAPVQQAAQHDCIGCIAPYAAVAPWPAAPLVTPPRQTSLDHLLLARLTAGPDTPPPRA